MEFSFSNALASLPRDAVIRILNEARPSSQYLFNSILPEQNRAEYFVSSGKLRVVSAMAGLAAMDSPYPPTGLITSSTFLEESAKLANQVMFSEKAQRELITMINAMGLSGARQTETILQEVLNFVDAVIRQPHIDAMEFLRGQALSTGALDWTFNGKHLSVDYGVPVGNKLSKRTGNDAYGGSTSKFWTDIRAAQRLLKYNVRAWIAHPGTIDVIISNSANNIRVTAQNLQVGTTSITKLVGSTEQASSDARDSLTLIGYGLEGEVIDPDDTTKTITKPFLPPGIIVAIGNNQNRGYVVGAGSRPPSENTLGYTHIAPTVEGGNVPGRWGRVYVPENRPWQLIAEGVTNGLPVIEAPDKIVILSTDMPS